MRVYRVETKYGLGPFIDCRASHSMILDMWTAKGYSMPVPNTDGIDLAESDYHVVCGCLTMAQLRMWFGCRSLVRKLRELGFGISVYEVDEEYVKFGGTQLAFRRDYATRINRR